jgi:AcrR family transcriptional regulator
LTEAQVKLAEEWIIEGKKSIKEICADLGGISTPAYYTYFPGGRNALLAKRFGIEAPKIVRAPRGQGKPYVRSGRPARRPLKLSTEQVERAKSLRAEARTFDQVAAELGVSVSTVRRALARG